MAKLSEQELWHEWAEHMRHPAPGEVFTCTKQKLWAMYVAANDALDLDPQATADAVFKDVAAVKDAEVSAEQIVRVRAAVLDKQVAKSAAEFGGEPMEDLI